MTSRWKVVSLLAPAVLLACWGRGAGRGVNPLDAVEQITVEVVNSSYSEATLHLFRGGERSRLGIVGALDESSFTVEWRHTLELQILIRLLAGPECLTRALQVEPGDIIELSIQNNLTRDLDCVRAPA